MEEISVYTSEILDDEKRKIGDEISRLSLLQNRTLKPDAIAEITRELIKRGYHSGQVKEAVNKLADQDLQRISLSVLVEELRGIPFSHAVDYCIRCGDIDQNGDYVASGYLPALEVSDDSYCHEVRIACNCQKGKRIAQKFGITLWNGNDRMESKKRNLILKFLIRILTNIQ
jgi:hypothetical protein